jgi:hypothetical protein
MVILHRSDRATYRNPCTNRAGNAPERVLCKSIIYAFLRAAFLTAAEFDGAFFGNQPPANPARYVDCVSRPLEVDRLVRRRFNFVYDLVESMDVVERDSEVTGIDLEELRHIDFFAEGASGKSVEL